MRTHKENRTRILYVCELGFIYINLWKFLLKEIYIVSGGLECEISNFS